MRASARVRERHASLELVERELRALVAGVEALGAEIDGVGAVRDAARTASSEPAGARSSGMARRVITVEI